MHRRFLLLLLSALVFLGAGCVRRQETAQAPPPGGIYRSDDQGASFTQRVSLGTGGSLARLTIREVAVVPQEPGTLYLVATEGVFRTRNAAETWERVRVPEKDVRSLTVHPTNPQIVFAAVVSAAPPSRGKILKSLNAGADWTDIFVAPAAEQSRGAIVRRRQEVPTLITALAVDPLRPEAVLAGTSNGALLLSADGGARWKTHASFRQGISAVKFSPTVQGEVFIRLADGQLLRSSDGGKTTKPAPVSRRAARAGGEEASPSFGTLRSSDVVHALLFLRRQSAGPEPILAGTESGLYRTTDGGASWEALPLPPTGGTGDIPVTSLAESADGTTWATSGFVLFSSRDQGGTWRARAGPLQKPIRFVVTDPLNANRVYLAFAP